MTTAKMGNEMHNEPLCPECGELLELITSDEFELDMNFFNYVKFCYGFCPKCGKYYKWKEVWNYSGVVEVEPDADAELEYRTLDDPFPDGCR